MPLYHYQVGFPKGLEFKPLFGFTYSLHARMEAMRDRYGPVKMFPQNFLPRTDKVVEAETDSMGNLVKIVFRKYYDAVYDLVIVLDVRTKVVKTVWLNARADTHHTLDRSRYDKP